MSDIRPVVLPTISSRGAETPRAAVVVELPSRTGGSRRKATAGTTAAPSDVEATADYIAQLSTELARLADGRRLTILSYFLDMAAAEARAVATAGARR